MANRPIARIRLERKKVSERRSSGRDRRMLDGTMKYRGEFHHVEIHNISESGVWAVAPVTVGLSDCVTLNVDLPELGGTVMITGRVRRVGLSSRELDRQGGFGLQFTRFYTGAGKMVLKTHLQDLLMAS